MRNSLYRYYKKYPLEKETVCAICGCSVRVIIHTTQQQSTKVYCREPCRAKRMSAVTVVWAESWEGVRIPNKPKLDKQTYMDLLRKSKGITQEAVDATSKIFR